MQHEQIMHFGTGYSVIELFYPEATFNCKMKSP